MSCKRGWFEQPHVSWLMMIKSKVNRVDTQEIQTYISQSSGFFVYLQHYLYQNYICRHYSCLILHDFDTFEQQFIQFLEN